MRTYKCPNCDGLNFLVPLSVTARYDARTNTLQTQALNLSLHIHGTGMGKQTVTCSDCDFVGLLKQFERNT